MGAKLYKEKERPSFIQYPPQVVETQNKNGITERSSYDDSLVFGQIPLDIKVFLLSKVCVLYNVFLPLVF